VKQKFSEQEILRLLSNLKNAENNYPLEMIQSRRDMFIQQAAAITVSSRTAGTGTNSGGDSGLRASGKPGAGSSSLGMFLEAALVITIALEAGVAAYIYRDKIYDFINTTFSPKVEVATYPTDEFAVTPDDLPVTGGEPSAEPTVTLTVTVTLTDTPPPLLVATESYEDKTNNAVKEAVSTPTPQENPGNHFGNTPKPERTKDANNNSSDNKDKTKDKKK